MEILNYILDRYKEELEESELNKIVEAYNFALEKHKGKKRKSGEEKMKMLQNMGNLYHHILLGKH